MKKILFFIAPSVLLFITSCRYEERINVNYTDEFKNVNHPQVAYWFFSPNMMPEERYKGKIDTFAVYSKYTLVYLTARDGCDFYDVKTMHPVFKKLVAYAHQKGLKIGLQIWKNNTGTLLENTDRLIQEGEVLLDGNGRGSYHVKAKGAREPDTIIKSELFKIYAFKKTSDGFYDPSTLKEITDKAVSKNSKSEVSLQIRAGSNFKGYTAYILTQHFYNSCSNFSDQAKSFIVNVFKAYSDIPFDAIGLDEYKNMTITREPVLLKNKEVFRERLYSIGMAKRMKETMGMDLDQVLFDMRFAPEGKPSVRIKAINCYMSLLRKSTLDVEKVMYYTGKELYGENTFIGLHNTFHNNLDQDEVWQTGVSWWDIKRDYGHTDEGTPAPIQLGIGMANTENAMYNMYYNRSIDSIWTKALYDLRYGIRTHYHAANDGRVWGVSIETPEALKKINKVENCARLLNRFNPTFPQIKLLVVYGMEAMYDWYPDTAQRGLYDINDKLGMEKKSVELWDNGYLNVSVPTDVIEDGRLKLNNQGKPEMHGYTFDAVILLDPQYSKEITTKFFQNYVNKGGKLLIEGTATRDFYGNDITESWKKIMDKAVATSYSLGNAAKLGIPKNSLQDGVENQEGSYTFTSIESLKNNRPAIFSFSYNGNRFEGSYKGLAAIQVNKIGNLEKLAATAFLYLKRNGSDLLRLSKAADVFIISRDGLLKATIADTSKSIIIK
jgi:hypothetical protein